MLTVSIVTHVFNNYQKRFQKCYNTCIELHQIAQNILDLRYISYIQTQEKMNKHL